jgi:hypothetical protein
MANPIVQQINTELENLQKELGQFKSTVEYLNGAKNQVKSAVESVNIAEEHFTKKITELKSTYVAFINLTDAVSSVISKIDKVNFPERLDRIENTVQETIMYLNETRTATLDELKEASEIITKADFDGRFKNLQVSIDSSVKSNENLAKSIEDQHIGVKIIEFERLVSKRIHESYKEVTKNTNQISADTVKSVHDLDLPLRMDKLDANVSGILMATQGIQGRLDLLERSLGDRMKNTSVEQSVLLKNFKEEIERNFFDLNNVQRTNNYITWFLIVVLAGIIIGSKYL